MSGPVHYRKTGSARSGARLRTLRHAAFHHHYHYYLDDAVDYTAAWTPTVSFRPSASTALGPHTLRFVLVSGAHEPITPLVETTASFTVQ